MMTIRKNLGISLLFIMVWLTISLAGCASYVNIPPDDKDTAINAVNLPPIPGVMTDALVFATTQYPVNNESAIILPAPASVRAFKIALNKISVNATAWQGDDDQRPAYRVLSVRVRGSAAIVDILLPQQLNLPDRKYLIEINLQGSITGWRVIGVKRLIPTTDQLQNAAAPAYPTAEIIEQPSDPEEQESITPQAPPAQETPALIIEDAEQDQSSVTEVNLTDKNNTEQTKLEDHQEPLHPIQPAHKNDK